MSSTPVPAGGAAGVCQTPAATPMPLSSTCLASAKPTPSWVAGSLLGLCCISALTSSWFQPQAVVCACLLLLLLLCCRQLSHGMAKARVATNLSMSALRKRMRNAMRAKLPVKPKLWVARYRRWMASQPKSWKSDLKRAHLALSRSEAKMKAASTFMQVHTSLLSCSPCNICLICAGFSAEILLFRNQKCVSQHTVA